MINKLLKNTTRFAKFLANFVKFFRRKDYEKETNNPDEIGKLKKFLILRNYLNHELAQVEFII